MLQPREQPGHTEFVAPKYHTRHLNRKSRSVSAPTGQMSTTLPEYLLSSVLPSTTPISEWSPRLKMPNSPVLVTSSQNRTQREQRMQRSASSMTLGPTGTAFGFLTFCSLNLGS